MKDRSAIDYLENMQRAASDALDMIQNIDQATFRGDRVLFSAITFCHFLIGEAAAVLLEKYPEFATDHPNLPWTALCDRRDRILRDFFDLDPTEVWEATQQSLPELLSEIETIRNWRAQGE